MNNFHLIMVHFPVGLLTLYAFLEVLSVFNIFYKKHSLEITKGIILFAGTIGAMLSRQTGEMISEGANKAYLSKNILELHEGFAFWATAVFVILSISYLIYFFENIEELKNHKLYTTFKSKIHTQLKQFIQIFNTRAVRVTLAIIGFCVILGTGTLGGILAHGCNSDPMTKLMCSIVQK